MSYAFRFYRFIGASAFLAGWAEAGLPVNDGEPQLPGGALDVVGPAPEDATPGFYVNAAFPAAPPQSLTAREIPANEALRVFAGWDDAGPPPPVPATIRLLQFLAQAAASGIITEAEAMAAAKTGEVPASIDGIFATLPAEMAFDARLAWAAMYEVDRASPLLMLVAASRGMSDADMDEFFRDAAAR